MGVDVRPGHVVASEGVHAPFEGWVFAVPFVSGVVVEVQGEGVGAPFDFEFVADAIVVVVVQAEAFAIEVGQAGVDAEAEFTDFSPSHIVASERVHAAVDERVFAGPFDGGIGVPIHGHAVHASHDTVVALAVADVVFIGVV